MCRNLSGCARIFETTRQKFSHRLIHWGTRYPRQAVGRWRSGRLGVFHSSPPAWAASLALAAIWAVSTPCGWAAEKAQGDQPQTVVDLFAGIQKGQIEAKLVAKDFTQCRLMVTNKTDAPISVRLPDVFAGVPVLAQLGMNAPGLNNNQPNSNNRNQKAPQSLGLTSPLGNMLNGINGNNPGGQHAFNIPPEKVEKIKLKAVCLDHGKPAPTHTTSFELKAFESVVQQPEVYEICRMMGQETVSQRVAQAAVWHLVNNLSWKDMALSGLKALFGPDAGHFTAAEIQAAQRVLKQATKTVSSRPPAQATTNATEQK